MSVGKYVKEVFIDRDVVTPSDYVITKAGGGALSSGDTTTFTASPGVITQAGTEHLATKYNNSTDGVENNTNSIGRNQGEFGFTSATVSNVTETSGSVELDAGQVSGTIEKVYAQTVYARRNIRVTPSNLDASNNLYYSLIDRGVGDTVILANTELTANIETIIDLSSVDITTYPNSLVVKYTLQRDGVGDTSPTVSSHSATWEGDVDVTTPLNELAEAIALGGLIYY